MRGEVSIPLGGHRLSVSKKLSDHSQREAEAGAHAGVGVSEIVDPDVFEVGANSDAMPGARQAAQMSSRLDPPDYEGVVFVLIEVC